MLYKVSGKEMLESLLKIVFGCAKQHAVFVIAVQLGSRLTRLIRTVTLNYSGGGIPTLLLTRDTSGIK